MIKTLHYTDGWKYQVFSSFSWNLEHKFKIKEELNTRYYSITKDGAILIKTGCCWDGATWFPDHEWIMIASLIHDVLHWLIARGIIPKRQNDLIDKELAHIIMLSEDKSCADKHLKKFRAWYVEKATNSVDQDTDYSPNVKTVSLDTLRRGK